MVFNAGDKDITFSFAAAGKHYRELPPPDGAALPPPAKLTTIVTIMAINATANTHTVIFIILKTSLRRLDISAEKPFISSL